MCSILVLCLCSLLLQPGLHDFAVFYADCAQGSSIVYIGCTSLCSMYSSHKLSPLASPCSKFAYFANAFGKAETHSCCLEQLGQLQ